MFLLCKLSTSTIGLELCQVVSRKQNGRSSTRGNRAGAPNASGDFFDVDYLTVGRSGLETS